MKTDSFSYSRAALIMGILVSIFLASMTFWVAMVSEPIGDDVAGHFEGSITAYLDDYADTVGERIHTLRQVLQTLDLAYHHWTGRVPTYFILPLLMMMPKLLHSALISVVFVGCVWLLLRVIYQKIHAVLLHPFEIFFLYIALFWYKFTAYYDIMNTLFSVYVIPLFLYLLYYNLAVVDGNRRQHGASLLLLNILGFIAGWCHEILSATLIAIIGIGYLQDVCSKREKWTALFRHTGLGLGFLVCCFSPGNFSRMHESHDSVLFTKSFGERLLSSIRLHAANLCLLWVPALIFLFLILALAAVDFAAHASLHGAKNTWITFLSQNAPYIGGGVISILVWGVAPGICYGMDLWICCFYIVLLNMLHMGVPALQQKRNLNFKADVHAVQTYVSLAVCVLFFFSNLSWIIPYSNTAKQRAALIDAAVAAGASEVVVPRYPEEADSCLNEFESLNNQDSFDSPFYIAYFGVHVILEDAPE